MSSPATQNRSNEILEAAALAAIGSRIRELRTKRSLTLQSLSETTGLSPSMLSLVERGKASPSVGSLVAISSALGVHMSDLLLSDRHDSDGPVSRRSEQPMFETSQGVLRRVLRDDRIRGVEVAVNEYAPETGSSTEPTHHSGYEYGIVVDGHLTVEVDGVEHILNPGDLISYDSTRNHRIWNHGSQRARALWVNLEHA
jgi:transcriptional regulator with XRE-family HTH domain